MLDIRHTAASSVTRNTVRASCRTQETREGKRLETKKKKNFLIVPERISRSKMCLRLTWAGDGKRGFTRSSATVRWAELKSFDQQHVSVAIFAEVTHKKKGQKRKHEKTYFAQTLQK